LTLEPWVLQHYEDATVRREVATFAGGRWVGVHCSSRDRAGRIILVRYLKGRHPLSINSGEDVGDLLRALSRLGPRTFYGTVNVYRRLKGAEDVADENNIIGCTPTWDIDNAPEAWKGTIEAAREIVSFLEREGIRRSVYVKLSGRGCHVHLHERAFSDEALARFPPQRWACGCRVRKHEARPEV
jgi:hypothetical protein